MFLLKQTSIFILLLLCSALLMFVCSIFGLIVKEFADARSFFYYGLLISFISIFLIFASLNRALSSPVRSQLLVVITSFIILPIFFTIPILSLLPDIDIHTLYFEMVSAFTTTGLTELYKINGISETILFWQALLAWFGGLIIWVFYFTVLSSLDINRIFMLNNKEGALNNNSQEAKRIHHTEIFLKSFISICVPYTIFTLILWGVLQITGENTLDALIYSMSTMSTSGISPHGSNLSASNSLGLLFIFMFFFFALTSNSLFQVNLMNFKKRKLNKVEMSFGVRLAFISALILMLFYFKEILSYGDLLKVFSSYFFTCLSFLTTTGWHLDPNLDLYGNESLLILVGLALIGGGVGTTAGGLKLLRLVIMKRHLRSEFGRMVHPSLIRTSESRMKLNDSIILKVWVFCAVLVFFILFCICCLSFCGVALKNSVFLSIAAFSNTGPLFEAMVSSMSLYEDFTIPMKYILILSMVLGRIEIVVLFALFNIDLWRKNNSRLN